MKKILFVLAILLSMAMIPRSYAYNFESDGIYYDITSPNTVAVTYATGSYNSYSDTVDIPSTVTYNGITYTVTGIGNNAFRNCSNLTRVTIPGTVTSIGEYAFYQCYQLHTITFPANLTTIGGSAFYYSGLYSVTIPAAVTSIGSSAFRQCNSMRSANFYATNCTSAPSIFYGCSHLDTLNIGSNVHNLPGSVFSNLSALKTVHIPNSVTSMGSNPFSNCPNLDTIVVAGGNSVFSSGNNSSYIVNTNTHTLVTGCKRTTIPNSVTIIGENAFIGCTGLSGSLNIPNQITVIGANAYSSCTGLSSLTIGHAVDSIGNSAFSGCSGISSVAFNADSCRYASSFSSCSSFSTLTIGNNVKAIPANAFYGCNHLTGMLVIPNSVKTVGNSAFYGCNGFTSLSLGNSVTAIGISAFSGCSNMGATLTIPHSVKTIGSSAFSGCTSFTTIAFNADSCTTGSLSGCSNVTSLTIGNNVKVIPASAFSGLNHISGAVSIPNSVISIGYNAFKNCTGLTGALVIPDSVINIGYSAFQGCTGMTSLTIGNAVSSIGSYAFQGCTGMTSLTIGNAVISIGSYAFQGCNGLASLVVGKAVSNIENKAFGDCTGLSFILFNADSCITMGSSYNNNPADGVFAGCTGPVSLTIGGNVKYIPIGAFRYFTGLAGPVNIPDSVKTIGDYAFQGCSGLTTLAIGNSVTSIGYSAFQGCSGLSSLVIGKSVSNIGNNAFHDCTVLSSIVFNADSCISTGSSSLFSGCTGPTSLTIGDNVKVIPNNSFDNFTGLTGLLNIPDSVIIIGNYAFQGCSSLSSLVIGKAVSTIGKNAFSNCTGLTSVSFKADSCISMGDYYGKVFSGCSGPTTLTISDNVKVIPNGAFENFTGLTSLTIGTDVSTIGGNAFKNCTDLSSVSYNADSCIFMGGGYHGKVFSDCTGPATLTIGDNVKVIPDDAFSDFTGLTGSLVIPDTVISIGNSAFQGCSGLTSLVIGNSITSISNSAFQGCSGLTSFVLGKSVSTIGESAFNGCNGLADTLTIPNSVRTIGASAFSGCSGIKTLTIGRDVQSVGNSAFSNCSSIASVFFNSDSCTRMHSNYYSYSSVFSGCDSISTLVIGENVKIIPEYAFFNVSSLSGLLTIPDSVSFIGNSAFYGCSGINGLIVGEGVDTVGKNAFKNCSGLNIVTFSADSCTYMGGQYDAVFNGCGNLTSLTIGDNVKSIPAYAFKNCSGLSTLIIPKSVKTIGGGAFSNCTGLSSIAFNADSCYTMSGSSVFNGCNNIVSLIIGENVKWIPNNAFYNLNLTRTLIIPNSVKSIGNSAFYGCSGLDTLIIGSSVNTVGNNAFYGCSNLNSLRIGNSVTMVGSYAFSNCSELSGALNIPNSVTTIGNGAFAGCTGIDSLFIGSGIESIGNQVFMDCLGITHVSFNADSCTTMGAWSSNSSNNTVFKGCTNITSLFIGENVKSIPDYAFLGLNNISGSLVIPDSVVSIGNYAFNGCSGYTSLTLGSSVAYIGQRAFANTIGTIYSYREIPSVINIFPSSSHSFYGINSHIPVYVPCGREQAYQDAWTYNSMSTPYFDNIYGTLVPYTFDVLSEDTLKGTVQITTQVTCTTPAVIKATPNFFYVFDHWSDGNTDNPRTIELTQDTLLVAYFREITLTVLQPSDTAMGQVVILQEPTKENPQTVVQVVPGPCYTFSDWRSPYNNWETISLSNPFTFTLTQDTVIRAYFNSETQISISSSTNNSICEGDSIVVTASGGESYIWTKIYWDVTQGRYFDEDTVGFDESVVLTETGSYRVKGTDTTGCYSWSNAFNVSALPSPSLTINGLTDICEGENTVISVVAQIESTSGLYEDFSNGIPSNWTVSNYFLTTYTIASDNSHGTAIKFPCYELYNGEVDELILPELDFGDLQAPMLKFDVAYRRYDYQSSDQLRVLCSANNGNSWIELYSKAGNVLSTLGVSNQNFIPSDNQWRTDSIDLSDYVGVANMKIKFEFTSDYGNNIWIDNIRVYSDGYAPSFLYEWSNGSTESLQTFDTSGTWQVIVTAENGCHSSESVSINLWQPADTTEITINSPDCNYVINGETFYQSGDYTQTLQTTHGCDSVVYLHLILTLDTTVVNDTVYGSYYYYGDDDTEVSISGYKYSYQYQMSPEQYPQWADSILAYQATHSNQIQYALSYDSSSNLASKSYIKIDDWRMLQGYAYYSKSLYPEYSIWKDSSYYDISDTLLAWSFFSGCDSTVIWNTRIMFGDRQYVYLDECGQYIWQGDSIFRSGTSASGTMVLGFASGDTLTESGMYYQQLTNVNGCDSSVYRYLTIHPAAYESVVESACESYTLNGTTYTESGVYTQHTDTTLVINRNLFWRSYNSCGYWNSWGLFTSYKPTGWSNLHSHYNYDDQWNVISVDYYFLNANGDTTHLDSANQVVIYVDTVNACKELTLNLTINHSVTESVEATACDSYTWNDSIYSQSGDYIQTFTSANGCDSVVTLHLTVNYSNTGDTSVVACDSFDWYEHIGITASGEYTHTFTNTSGCDSVVTLHLTVNTSDHTELTAAACGQYVWLDSTYTESDNYSVTYTNTAGCDSIVTLHLTINPIPEVVITGNTTICPGGGTMLTATGADTYMWSNYSTTASIPVNVFGVYSVTGTTSAGCTNTASVTVLVAQPPMITVTGDLDLCAGETGTITAHGGTTYMWSNGSTDSVLTVNATGTWQVIGYDENGCNSMTNVSVTVWQPVNTQYSVTVNDSCYIWNSISYCESGDYTQTFQTVHGCDSVVTLHLTFTTSIYADLYETACDSYTWNNATYVQSGDYMQSFVLPNGSDSIVTLHLTIYPSVSSDFTIVTEDSCYLWNNIEYCTSGDYTQTFQTMHGCDSVVTLHLTITVGVDDHETVDFKVYPNPTNGVVNVECIMKNEEWGEVELHLVDAYGRVLDVVEANNHSPLLTAQIDLSQYASGVYFVKAMADGKAIATRKVVKQ